MLLTLPPSLKLWRTGKKQIASIFTLCFIFACVQNVHAMRCNIKNIKSLLTYKAPRFFCSKLEKSDGDVKKLQQIYDSLWNLAPKGFLTDACVNHNSCCLLAKNDEAQAKKGKAIRLKKMLTEDGSASVHMLRDIQLRMLILEEKNMAVQKIVAESQDKEALTSSHESFCKLIKFTSECLTYSTNIYGKTFYEHSADYYAQHPQGLFDSTKHMTPTDHIRYDLQNECNKINKKIMKDNGYRHNKNILLGWGEHTMDPAYVGAWLKAIERAHRGHDQDGGGVY